MQISYYKLKLELLESDLGRIALLEPNKNYRILKSYLCIYNCLKELREYMRANPFKKQQYEIYFFKRIKPVIIGRWHYLMIINHYGNRSPFKAVRMTYWMRQLEIYRKFFNENKEFDDYMVEKEDAFDSVFFVSQSALFERGSIHQPSEAHPAYPFFEPDFSSIYDYRLALWIAYTALQAFAERLLGNLGPKLLN